MNETATGTAPDKIVFTSTDEVLNFVNLAKFKHGISDPMEAKPTCIDGRERKDENGPLAIAATAGGSAGELMAALATCNSFEIDDNDHVLQAYLAGTGGSQNFIFHTDDEHLDKAGTGCGHLNQARGDEQAYSLRDGQMTFLDTFLAAVKEQGGIEEVCLAKHEEKAILDIHSKTWTVRPFVQLENGEGQGCFTRNDYFVKLREELIGRALYQQFSVTAGNHSEEDFVNAMHSFNSKQLGVTANRIAKGVPMYEVHINDGDGSVTINAA